MILPERFSKADRRPGRQGILCVGGGGGEGGGGEGQQLKSIMLE